MTVADDALDAVIQDQISLTRLEANEIRQVFRTLKRLEGELVGKLADIDPTSVTRRTAKARRLERLLAEARALISQTYSELNREANTRNARIAAQQSRSVVRRTNERIGAEVLRHTLPAEQARRVGRQTLIQGAVSRDWWNGQSRNLQRRFEQEMRTGLLANESIPDLMKRIRGSRALGFTDGIMQVSRNHAASLIRTSVSAVANEARAATYQENSDVIKGIQWQAVLDTRTTPICQALDGLVWDLEYNPVDHNFSFPGPTAHFGERSTQVPVLKSFEELAGQDGTKNLAKRLDRELSDSKRASMNGEVSGKQDYESWLRRQPKSVQEEALGVRKRELWIKGDLSFRELIDQQGRPLTIEQLEEKV